jgi:exonuclease VII small subunit
MAFTVNDFHDLVRLLEEQPEWRAELRRLLLPDELLTLPALVRELAESHKRAEERLSSIEKRLEGVENRLERVEERTGRLEEGQARLEEGQARLEEGQARLEMRVGNLEEGQARLEVRVGNLEEGQARLEEGQARLEMRVGNLEEGQARLEEGQARLEVRVGNLEEGQARLETGVEDLKKAVHSLQFVVGATAEESAEGMLYFVLPRKGYQLVGDPFYLRMNGDVDVAAEAIDPEGNTVWVVVEAKVRLSHRAVMAWANRMRSESFREMLKEAGVPGPYLVYSYGMRVDASALDAAEKAGIGLLTSQDERVAPQQLIPTEEVGSKSRTTRD